MRWREKTCGPRDICKLQKNLNFLYFHFPSNFLCVTKQTLRDWPKKTQLIRDKKYLHHSIDFDFTIYIEFSATNLFISLYLVACKKTFFSVHLILELEYPQINFWKSFDLWDLYTFLSMGNDGVEGPVSCGAWIRRPEKLNLVVLGRCRRAKSSPSLLHIFSFDPHTTSLSSSPLVFCENFVSFCFWVVNALLSLNSWS